MQDDKRKKHQHFILRKNGETERFSSPGRGDGGASIPDRDRQTHGNALLGKLQ